jgi:1-aminocyclopropane-1-carboxylate deaminase
LYQTPLGLKQVLTTPLQPIQWPRLSGHQQAWIKRDDLNHPRIQGNKWHKLRLNILAAQQAGCDGLLTFGGAHSNHIAATAAAAYDYGIAATGIIRGDELSNNQQSWSATLKNAAAHGMTFRFVSRRDYRQRNQADCLAKWHEAYPNYYFIPEGGSNALAITAMADVIAQINAQCPDWTHLLCAVGTGATLAGLAKATPNKATTNKTVWGIASLKQAEHLIPQIETWIGKQHSNWRLLSDLGNRTFHGGGYGKTTPEITAIQQQFEQQNRLLLDPIYTAKVVYAFDHLLAHSAFPEDSRIIIYHSGGLQGRSDWHES